MELKRKQKEFLKDLAELLKKYNVSISYDYPFDEIDVSLIRANYAPISFSSSINYNKIIEKLG